MACYITSGEELGCSDSIGGIKKVYIVGGGGEVTGYTYNAAGAITGATSTTGTTLYGFELKRGVSSLTQTLNKSYENGTVFFTQELTIALYKYDTAKRDKLKVLSQNDNIQIVAIDQNDVQYFLGQVNGMYLSGGSAATGTAFGDRNGFEMIFTGQEHEPANMLLSGTYDEQTATYAQVLGSIFTGATING
jgi:hypothetical protein